MQAISGARATTAGLALAGLTLLSGCDALGNVAGADEPLSYRVTVRPKELTLRVGYSAQLTATVHVTAGGDTSVRWLAPNENLLSVNDGGVVTCLMGGRGIVYVIATASEERPDAPPAGDTAFVTCSYDVPAPQPTPDPEPTPTPEPGQPASIELSPTTVAFEHNVGSSPCPQQAGEFLVRNTGTQQVSVRVTSGHGAIVVNPTAMTLAPGASRSVGLGFNCATQQSFGTEVTVSATAGQSSCTERVRVNATIN